MDSHDDEHAASAIDYTDDYAQHDEPDAESAMVAGSNNAEVHTRDHDDDADALESGPESTGLNAIHSSYLRQIRSLQKTNSSLQKKIDYLSALQNDHTKIKLVKKLQRILREKQIMVDDLAEMVMDRGIMSVEALSAHLQSLIEHNALDQPNPAKLKKELLESRKTEAATRLELNKLKKQIRGLDGSAAAKEAPPASNSGAISARTVAARNEANVQQMEAERTAHAALRTEFLALSASYTSLQSSHHTLTLSLGEHKKLIADVTSENRTLRGYLTQWEASEERRILAEQNILLLQESAQRTYQEREGIFQEMRLFKQKLLLLAKAKTKAAEEATAAIALARKNEQNARDHASVLSRQLELLKADLKSSGEIVEWHRSQNVLHLSKAAQSDVASLEKKHAEEIAKLNKRYEALVNKHALLMEKEGEETPSQRVSHYALLKENAALLNTVALLETEVGTLGTKVDAADKSCADAQSHSKQSATELEVLQRALQQMALDLQEVQRSLREKDAALQHAVEVKIPKMRTQRQNLALACQRQNATIQELTRQIEAAGGTANANSHAATGEHRSSSHKRRDGHSSSSSHKHASASAADISRARDSSSSPPRKSTSGSGSVVKRPQSAHVQSTSAADSASPTKHAEPASRKSASPVRKAAAIVHAAAAVAADDDYDDDPFAAVAAAAPASRSDQSAPAASAASPSAAASATPSSADWIDPSGTWVRYATDDGAAWYYYNNWTGESVWTDPLSAQQAMNPGEAVAEPVPLDSPYGEPASAPSESAASASRPGRSSASAAAAVTTSDLDLTPMTSQRSELPQLSNRGPNPKAASASAAASPPTGDPFADDEFPVEEAVEEEPF